MPQENVNELSQLREMAHGLSLLYVEENEGLRTKMHGVLEKFFTGVLSFGDGAKGLEAFRSFRPQIVITGINTPSLDGFNLIKRIKKIEPMTKFIILSSSEDRELLHKAITLGVCDYLNKPVKVNVLYRALIRCIGAIDVEENGSLFNHYMNDMLNYQGDPLAMISQEHLLFVNQMFLDFFGVADLDEFYQEHKGFGELLREHKGFLYNHEEKHWFNEASSKPGKLFHVKIANLQGESRHFILKLHQIPQKQNIYIMSLNDITDLNLLSLYDSKAVLEDERHQNQDALLKLFQVVKKNNAEIKIHNFYKGLAITNVGSVVQVDDKAIILKTTYIQQKAVKLQQNMLISSEIFPHAILCEPILKVDFDRQMIACHEMRFVEHNATQRKAVRVFPEEHHTVTLFYEERKFYGDVVIHDLSIEALKLEMNALPAGLKEGSKVAVDMVLEHHKKPLIIHSMAEVIRIEEKARSYFIALAFDLEPQHKKHLIDYVSVRQMNLIREFKGLKFGTV